MKCLFCDINKGDIPSYTIYENEYVRCFLDINPISKGHTLIIPKKHFTDIFDINEKYLYEINKASKVIVYLINEKYRPNGIRLVQNNGSFQEIKHYHLHIIPEYKNKEVFDIEKVYNELK